jgi:hypothetical protein
MEPYRKGMGPTTCVRCDSQIDPHAAFLTGDGPICDPCHREAAREAKAAAHARTVAVDVLLYGLLAVAGGLSMLALGLLLPEGPVVSGVIKIASLGAAVSLAGCIQAFRIPAEKARARLGRRLGVGGAIAALFGLLVLLARVL